MLSCRSVHTATRRSLRPARCRRGCILARKRWAFRRCTWFARRAPARWTRAGTRSSASPPSPTAPAASTSPTAPHEAIDEARDAPLRRRLRAASLASMGATSDGDGALAAEAAHPRPRGSGRGRRAVLEAEASVGGQDVVGRDYRGGHARAPRQAGPSRGGRGRAAGTGSPPEASERADQAERDGAGPAAGVDVDRARTDPPEDLVARLARRQRRESIRQVPQVPDPLIPAHPRLTILEGAAA